VAGSKNLRWPKIIGAVTITGMSGLSTFRIGGEAPSEQAPKGALRLATVRFLPRGMSVAERKRRNMFDVWFPLLAPSAELFRTATPGKYNDKSWARYAARYRKEMQSSVEKREALKLVALLARDGQVSVGCYCADESRCHRSLLKGLIEDAAKEI
jgi:uncharacterized protein YeaO (DUF488 family)